MSVSRWWMSPPAAWLRSLIVVVMPCACKSTNAVLHAMEVYDLLMCKDYDVLCLWYTPSGQRTIEAGIWNQRTINWLQIINLINESISHAFWNNSLDTFAADIVNNDGLNWKWLLTYCSFSVDKITELGIKTVQTRCSFNY